MKKAKGRILFIGSSLRRNSEISLKVKMSIGMLNIGATKGSDDMPQKPIDIFKLSL
ncbi:MAG: hypothetical protein RR806_01560 [Oscillospiraceae bacterium]